MARDEDDHRKAVIGNVNGTFWLYDSETGFDLTHPSTPTEAGIKNAITVQTATLPIKIDPAKSALVVVDMQNFFLSTALGLSADSKGLKAQKNLLQYAIPAARKAGIRIVWLNWGLTEEEIEKMPPAVHRSFGFETVGASELGSFHLVENKIPAINSHSISAGARLIPSDEAQRKKRDTIAYPSLSRGFGAEIGSVTLDDGNLVEAGRLLCRDSWNAELTPDLLHSYQEGLKLDPPDVWVHKNRLSGMWGDKTQCTEFLDQVGIKTLFFTGVNTDQCMGGSLVDAYNKGYDCVMLKDGTATTNPLSSQECYELNAATTYGFLTTCKDLWDAVNQ